MDGALILFLLFALGSKGSAVKGLSDRDARILQRAATKAKISLPEARSRLQILARESGMTESEVINRSPEAVELAKELGYL